MVVKTALVRQIQGIRLAGKTDSNHWIVMDGPPEFGGSDAGIRPKELLLLALGGCTASDVIYGEGIYSQDVERAIELSESKYWSVNAMLQAAVSITRSYRIVPSCAAVRAA
jgi:putative redox protein